MTGLAGGARGCRFCGNAFVWNRNVVAQDHRATAEESKGGSADDHVLSSGRGARGQLRDLSSGLRRPQTRLHRWSRNGDASVPSPLGIASETPNFRGT